jgi:hypothetical protein
MTLDPARLRTLKQYSSETKVFTVNYLRWLINNAPHNGFQECFVKIGARVFVDPIAVTAWLATQQAQPQPHNRGIARKRLSAVRQQELAAV